MKLLFVASILIFTVPQQHAPLLSGQGSFMFGASIPSSALTVMNGKVVVFSDEQGEIISVDGEQGYRLLAAIRQFRESACRHHVDTSSLSDADRILLRQWADQLMRGAADRAPTHGRVPKS